MLFGTCNCNLGASSISRRGLLCAGGAGFVSALIGTLVETSRTAQAQTLGSQVPEVDRLAVRIVTDNQVIQFIPSEKREGLTIERKGGNQTPDAPPSTALNGEWGLSMHAESRRGNEVRNVLIDFGYTPEMLLNNMSILKIDPATFDALVLSHGHYDHFGGIVGFLSANKGKLKKNLPFFVGGEDCFCTRETALRSIRLARPQGHCRRKPFADDGRRTCHRRRSCLHHRQNRAGSARRNRYGRPARRSALSTVSDASRTRCHRRRTPVPSFRTILSTRSAPTSSSRARVSSCSPRAAIAASSIRSSRRRPRPASRRCMPSSVASISFRRSTTTTSDRFIATMKEVNPDYLIPGHCSGDRFYDLARIELGDKVIHSAVGTRFVFGA